MPTFIYRHISEIINISEVINCFRIVDQPEDIPLSTLCSYDFWLMAYCKKGKVEEYDEDGQVVTLSDGDVMFHEPGKRNHSRGVPHNHSECYYISFKSSSKIMGFFEGCATHLTDFQRQIMDRIIDIASETFEDIGEEDKMGVKILPNSLIGSQQLYKNYLEIILLELFCSSNKTTESFLYSSKEEFEKFIYHKIEELLNNNIYSRMTMDMICKELGYSKTVLSTIYKKYASDSIINRYNYIKIKESKRLLIETEKTVDAIANELGFNGGYYFATVFKKFVGKSPSEYRKEKKH